MYIRTDDTLVLRDSPEHIDFHIKTGDYFSFLATMMGFMEEALGKCESELVSEQERLLARELRHDLHERRGIRLVREPEFEPDGLADAHAELLGEPRRNRLRCNSARLRVADHAVDAAACLET